MSTNALFIYLCNVFVYLCILALVALDYARMLLVWQELECTELRSLLYTLHAFLSAKLASIDPVFLLNLWCDLENVEMT